MMPASEKRKTMRTKEEFKREVETWAAKIKVKPAQIRMQKMKKKWASCSTSGRISFSEALLSESTAFQRYVIVHELLHLRIPNHGKLFKSMLSVHVPGWEKICKKESGHRP